MSSRPTRSEASCAATRWVTSIAAGAPLYMKFGLRNSRALYPCGEHLVADACAIAREKVHRAAVALEWLRRLAPELEQSAPHAPGLGIPQPGPQPS